MVSFIFTILNVKGAMLKMLPYQFYLWLLGSLIFFPNENKNEFSAETLFSYFLNWILLLTLIKIMSNWLIASEFPRWLVVWILEFIFVYDPISKYLFSQENNTLSFSVCFSKLTFYLWKQEEQLYVEILKSSEIHKLIQICLFVHKPNLKTTNPVDIKYDLLISLQIKKIKVHRTLTFERFGASYQRKIL